MRTLEKLKNELEPGRVYRRAKLAQWSTAVDRHLKVLLDEGFLKKMSQGLYYCPKHASFGEVAPTDEELVKAFLKSDDFLLTSYNNYNALGVGTTQLYNHQLVYNHKRHGEFELGGKTFDFRLKHKFPHTTSKEFLVVDLLNNLNDLADDREVVMHAVTEKYFSPPASQFEEVFDKYAGERTKALLHEYLKSSLLTHA